MAGRRPRRLDRRDFLRTAAIAGGAATLGTLPGWTRSASGLSLPIGGLTPLPNPNSAPVDHIIVLMMENRSFDHYFGHRTGTNAQTYLDHPDQPDHPNHGNTVDTFHLGSRHEHTTLPGEHDPPDEPSGDHDADYRGCGHSDPGHGWNAGRAQVADGFLTGNNDEFAVGYYLREDLPFYNGLADRFTLCDNYFCSVLGPTFPNREYMHSAQSGGLKSNALPPEVPGQELGFDWLTIWDLLEMAGIPWAYYFVDLPAIGLWGARLAKGARHIEHFFADAYAGTLPNVVFVDPGFTTGLRTDEHPYSDVRTGEAFTHNIVKAVVESPLWRQSALFVNYDEWGGFFDHVQTPPRTADVRATDGDPGGDEDFGQLGFRVPCSVISPYAREGMLASEIAPGGRFYDHTSILKFIEWRFGLPALTARDAAAANIGELLDFTIPVDQARDAAEVADGLIDPIFRLPVASLPCKSHELEGLFLPENAQGLPHEAYPDPVYDAVNDILDPANRTFDDDFQAAYDSGYFERVGFRLERKPWRYAFGG